MGKLAAELMAIPDIDSQFIDGYQAWEAVNEVVNENDTLTQRVSELEAERKWISVDDRLPDARTTVLFYDKAFANITIGSVNDPLNIDGDISHWMPMFDLQPPKDQP